MFQYRHFSVWRSPSITHFVEYPYNILEVNNLTLVEPKSRPYVLQTMFLNQYSKYACAVASPWKGGEWPRLRSFWHRQPSSNRPDIGINCFLRWRAISIPYREPARTEIVCTLGVLSFLFIYICIFFHAKWVYRKYYTVNCYFKIYIKKTL